MSNRKVIRGGVVRVGLVTEELASGTSSGGIGSAFHELAIALARAGYSVDVLYMPIVADAVDFATVATYYSAHSIRVLSIPVADYVWETGACEARSYALLHYLRELDTAYDILHFHEYKGLGCFPIRAKRQALALPTTTIVMQCHGPTRWTLEANGHPFSHEDQLKIDLMERACVEGADIVVSPSQYLLDWFALHAWRTPPGERTHVIQNVCTSLVQANLPYARASTEAVDIDEIVFFGRHEERKGIVPFCDALDLLADRLCLGGIRVTFLGGFGVINDQPSGLYVADRARAWTFPIDILPDMDRAASTRHLATNPHSIVVIPSPVENSPFTVLEAAALGKPLLTSDAGGACELLAKTTAEMSTCHISGRSLAARLSELMATGLRPASLAISPAATEKAWLHLHRDIVGKPLLRSAPKPAAAAPSVTVVITHFERPQKLYDALLSIAQQTYPHIDIVVIDDGSRNQDSLDCLTRLQPLLHRIGARFLTQENQYLGAARNHAARTSESDYLLFLDDDDIALPHLVQTLVTACEATRADVMQCLNLFMDVDLRSAAVMRPERFRQKVSYIPLGGPLSLAPLQNVFGSATCLIRRSAFTAVGGYTEQFGVGHEDYELYVRMLQAGYTMDVCPIPLYLYETGRPSMITRTSRYKNFNRVAKAVDLTGSPQAMADLVSLCAGRRAQEHTANYRSYLLRMDGNSGMLQQLDKLNSKDAEYTRLVSAYADEAGATSFAAALRAVTSHRTRESTLVPPRAARPVTTQQRPRRESDALIVGMLVDLSFARYEEAVAAFCLGLGRTRSLTEPQSMALLRFAAAPDIPPDVLAPMAAALHDCKIGQRQFGRLAGPLVTVALRAADMDLVLSVIERACTIGHARYIEMNADVRMAVEAGDLQSGFEHFVACGRAESRQGYEELVVVHASAEEEMATDIPLADLWRAISVLREVGLGEADLGSQSAPVAVEA
jgi:glycosyltransferase involved in cell wall biosynthesis